MKRASRLEHVAQLSSPIHRCRVAYKPSQCALSADGWLDWTDDEDRPADRRLVSGQSDDKQSGHH